MTTLTASAARREASWASEEETQGGRGKTALILAAILLAGGAGAWQMTRPATSPTATGRVATPALSSPGPSGAVAMRPPASSNAVVLPLYFAQGTQFRVHGRSGAKGTINTKPTGESTWKCRVVSVDATKGVTVSGRIEKFVDKGPSPRVLPPGFKERDVTVSFRPNGALAGITGVSYTGTGGNVDGTEILFALDLANSVSGFVGNGRAMKEGESFTSGGETILPFNPPLNFSNPVTTTVGAVAMDGGRRVTRIFQNGNAFYSGLILNRTVTGDATKTVLLKSMNAEFKGGHVVDQATGRPLRGEGDVKLKLEIAVQMTKGGKVVGQFPVPIPEVETHFISAYEYLE